MKTAVTVLQEMMMKFGETPEYDCVAQEGLQHQATFEFRCAAHGEVSRGVARSKKEAKQEAARAMLAALAARGLGAGPAACVAAPPAAAPAARSRVALLRELCEEYGLPGVEYALVGDTGPPHQRRFTVRAAIGQHARLATSSQKKAARQLAADALYRYLRENLKLTADFVEEEALARAHERAMERYRETRADHPARPALGQRVADFHLALADQYEAEKRALAREALEASGAEAEAEGEGGAEARLELAAGALGAEVAWSALPAALHVAALAGAAPPLAFAGRTRAAAAAAAIRFLRRAL